MDSEKYERARVELIEAELEKLQTHLREAAVALGESDFGKAREKLEQADHAHELALFHIEKLPAEEPSLRSLAQTLEDSLNDLKQQIANRSPEI